MRRLTAILVLALGTLAAMPAGGERAPGRVYRIGWLRPGGAGSPQHTFLVAMRDLGYVPGRNLVVEHRAAEGKIERLPAMAAELAPILSGRAWLRAWRGPVGT